MEWKFLKFFEKIDNFVEKLKHRDFKNSFRRARNIKKTACKILRVLTKIEEHFQKILRFFDQNLYGNLTFSHFY